MNVVFAGSDEPEFNHVMAMWLAAELAMPRPFRPPHSTMGIFDDDGQLAAVLIFENYRPEDGTVEIGGASVSAKWLTANTMKALADFVFNRLGCQMAVMRVPERNVLVSRFLTRAGFEDIFIPRLRGRHEGEHFFCMTEEAWANSRLNHGNRSQ